MATVRKSRGSWVADFTDQQGRRHIETPRGPFETKAEEKLAAHNLLNRRLSEVNSNCFVPNRQRLTFKRLAETWIAGKIDIDDTTRSDYSTMLECFLLPYFGNRKAETLTRLDIEVFRNRMRGGLPECCRSAREAKQRELRTTEPGKRLKPLKAPGARTINKCLSIVISILGYGKKIHMLSDNVAEGIEKLPVAEGEDRCIEKYILTTSELRLTLEHARDPYRVPIALGLYTGMLQEEILGLKWSDFSASFTTSRVMRVYRRGRFAALKTTSRLRTIEIPTELQQILTEWRPRCPHNDHDLVCPSVTGLPMHASALLQRGFRPALERAGVRRVRFHDVRHSFASNLLEAGVEVVKVSKALGHANIQITTTIYAHAIPMPRHSASDCMGESVHPGSPHTVHD